MWGNTDNIPRDWVCVDWNVPEALVSSVPYSLGHILHIIFWMYADEIPFDLFNEEQHNHIMYGLL